MCRSLTCSTVHSFIKNKKKVLTAFYVTGTGPGSGDTSEPKSPANGKKSVGTYFSESDILQRASVLIRISRTFARLRKGR